MTALQVAGNSLQLLGVVITGLGLLYAWNRASGRFDQWRQSVTSMLAELRAKLTPRTGVIGAAVVVEPEITASATVRHPGETEERLDRIEDNLATLPGQIKKEIKAVEAAMDEKLAEFDATGKGIAVKDIYWALGGIGIQVVGYVLSLIGQLSG